MGSSLMVSESRGLESGVWAGTCPQRQQGKELGASRTTGSLVDGGTPVPRPGPWTQKRVLAGPDQEKKFQGLGWAPSAQRSYAEPTLRQTSPESWWTFRSPRVPLTGPREVRLPGRQWGPHRHPARSAVGQAPSQAPSSVLHQEPARKWRPL